MLFHVFFVAASLFCLFFLQRPLPTFYGIENQGANVYETEERWLASSKPTFVYYIVKIQGVFFVGDKTHTNEWNAINPFGVKWFYSLKI